MSAHHAQEAFDPRDAVIPEGHAWRRLPLYGAGLGAVGTLASLALAVGQPRQFFFSWLVAFLFVLSVATGAMFFVLVQLVAKARWSVVVRRLAENMMATFPFLALLFIPVAVGIPQLFHWADATAMAHDPVLAGKRAFLNVPFFLIRALIYFVAWSGVGLWFVRRSTRQDQTHDVATTLDMVRVGAPALFVFAITTTLAAVDWIMSLDPHWYSTVFGVYWFGGCLVAVFSSLSLLALALRRAGLLSRAITVEHYHDLGKLLYTYLVFWGYIGFSQFFLIWYANLPEETIFYRHRLTGSWRTVTLCLALGHFCIPFLGLMSRNVKRRLGLLAFGAIWMLSMHLLDLHWLVMPTLHADGFAPSLLDVTTLLAVVGWFLAALGWQLRRRALVPLGDPHLAQSLRFENA
jgi:hypothetical protein